MSGFTFIIGNTECPYYYYEEPKNCSHPSTGGRCNKEKCPFMQRKEAKCFDDWWENGGADDFDDFWMAHRDSYGS